MFGNIIRNVCFFISVPFSVFVLMFVAYHITIGVVMLFSHI